MKMLLILLLLLFSANGFANDNAISQPTQSTFKNEKKIILPEDPSSEDFDYPIITDDEYPFLMERDQFQSPNKE